MKPSSPKTLALATLLATTATTSAKSSSKKTTTRSLTGSSWLGIDGNWSATAFTVADQSVNLFISTTLSEHWVIDSAGCNTGDSLCTTARGGVVDVSAVSAWSSLGTWSIGLSYLGIKANALYGTDKFSLTDDLTSAPLTMTSALVGALNTTAHYVGLFGLGNVPGKFGTKTVDAPFSEMVQDKAWFPSYTYGYTAGAAYKNMPSSLTLGGYDAARLPKNPDNIDFTLSRDTLIPRVLVRAIEVSSGTSTSTSTPGNWNASSQVLSNFTNSFQAIIDSSTPYLWLPDLVVDGFVSAMNLTYNSTLEAYVLSSAQLAALAADDAFTFTFCLSSYDNTNNFGKPYDIDGIVNVTLSGAAFAHVLSYPYHNQAIAYGDPDVPYFPVKKATTSTFVLGRAFLQEVYMLTRYDSSSFQLHPAAFPDDPIGDRNIQTVTQPPNSIYPGPGKMSSSAKKFSKGAIAGIVVGSVAGAAIAAGALWLFLRRRRRNRAQKDPQFEYKIAPTEEPPRTPIGRLLSKFRPGKSPASPLTATRALPNTRSLTDSAADLTANDAVPPHIAEVSADADTTVLEIGAEAGHQVFEMPDTSAAAVELDSSALDDLADFSAANGLSSYEIAQQKIDLALQGPVPPYTEGDHGAGILPPEKVAVINELEYPVPARAVFLPPGSSSGPSPVSPGTGTWGTQTSAGVSSLGGTDTLRSTTSLAPSAVSAMSGNSSSSSSLSSSTSSGPRTMQTAIEADQIVCLGALPEGIAVPGRDPMPPAPVRQVRSRGEEIVHVPQVAEKRYSWEESQGRRQ